MPRFFVPSENFTEDTVRITDNDAFHIARSLRMAVGDEITVCDMHGAEYKCTLTKIRDEECVCQILESRQSNTEPPVDITLFMAYPKGDKLETIVQKSVELGVLKIVPFESSRCIKRPKAEKAEKQTLRLMRIAEEASKQCGRARLTEISQPTSFDTALDMATEGDLKLFCYEGDGTLSLKSVLNGIKGVKTVSVFVGSEGGFSLDEVEKAVKKGFIPINLGPRILRCETAPSYVLSAISFFFEL